MKLLIAADIFGRTKELDNIADCLSVNYSDVILIDPYNGNYMNFEIEQDAYRYFQENIGLEQYKNMIAKVFTKNTSALHLLGFSVGASAIWTLSNKKPFHPDTKAVCFYGSQIRHFLNLKPAFKIHLFFPRSEPHFTITDVIEKLSQQQNVQCCITDFLHGFMNKKSKNFDETAYTDHIRLIKIIFE